MASFPNSVKSFTTKNSGDVIQPADVNDLQSEVNAIESGYLTGTAPLNSSNSTVVHLSVTAGLNVVGNSTLASTITIGAIPYVFPSTAGTAGQVLAVGTVSGSTLNLSWVNQAAAVILQNSDFAIATVQGSVSVETSILNSGTGFSIPSNTLVTGKAFRFFMGGSAVNNTAGGINFTVKAKLGATTFASVLITANANGITPWTLTYLINANGSSTSQRAVGTYGAANAVVADGGIASAGGGPGMHSTLAIDMSTTQTFNATLQWASTNSSMRLERYSATLELLG